MRAHRLSAYVVLVLFSTSLLACGGGGGGTTTTTAEDPTVTDVTPPQGPVGGGTPLTITGTNFAAGATVTVGGNAATAVDVPDATTINCNTPAGTAGQATVTVTVDGVMAAWDGRFTYVAVPPPTFLSIAPAIGTTFGGLPVTITGEGFTANGAGTNTVMIRGLAATGVSTINDTTIHCFTPPTTPGSNVVAPVTVMNVNGTTSPGGSFTYYEPILVADGGGAPPPVWNLTAVDPVAGLFQTIGPIGFGVAGMDFDAATGTLYGVTDPGLPNGRQLITIDPQTGAGTLIGNLDSPGPVNHPVPDCAFVNTTLYGTDGPGPVPFGNLVTINPASGAVTISGASPAPPLGGALAANVTNTSVIFMASETGSVYSVAVGTSTFTPLSTMTGIGLPVGTMLAATYHNGTLYAVDADMSNPSAGSVRQGVMVAPATGTITVPPWPPLPPYTSAMASRTR